ncbi:unnamed protein product [Lactuca virosa]|uniref:Uncharacterized protein n=1 Tax=Lactuca virosa TaxID=75947 RepID=A0AAU9P036_9ASTR|nr:unnamed protein product [Lactuca virosa]
MRLRHFHSLVPDALHHLHRCTRSITATLLFVSVAHVVPSVQSTNEETQLPTQSPTIAVSLQLQGSTMESSRIDVDLDGESEAVEQNKVPVVGDKRTSNAWRNYTDVRDPKTVVE